MHDFVRNKIDKKLNGTMILCWIGTCVDQLDRYLIKLGINARLIL